MWINTLYILALCPFFSLHFTEYQYNYLTGLTKITTSAIVLSELRVYAMYSLAGTLALIMQFLL